MNSPPHVNIEWVEVRCGCGRCLRLPRKVDGEYGNGFITCDCGAEVSTAYEPGENALNETLDVLGFVQRDPGGDFILTCPACMKSWRQSADTRPEQIVRCCDWQWDFRFRVPKIFRWRETRSVSDLATQALECRIVDDQRDWKFGKIADRAPDDEPPRDG